MLYFGLPQQLSHECFIFELADERRLVDFVDRAEINFLKLLLSVHCWNCLHNIFAVLAHYARDIWTMFLLLLHYDLHSLFFQPTNVAHVGFEFISWLLFAFGECCFFLFVFLSNLINILFRFARQGFLGWENLLLLLEISLQFYIASLTVTTCSVREIIFSILYLLNINGYLLALQVDPSIFCFEGLAFYIRLFVGYVQSQLTAPISHMPLNDSPVMFRIFVGDAPID